jgi:hypothetical protein
MCYFFIGQYILVCVLPPNEVPNMLIQADRVSGFQIQIPVTDSGKLPFQRQSPSDDL